MSGTIKSISGNTLTFEDDSTHAVAASASVTLNGAASSLGALKAGDKVSLSGDPATSVTATR